MKNTDSNSGKGAEIESRCCVVTCDSKGVFGSHIYASLTAS